MNTKILIGFAAAVGLVVVPGATRAQTDCRASSVLAEPLECGSHAAPGASHESLALIPSSMGFAHDIRDTDDYVRHPLGDFSNQTIVGNNTQNIFAYALTPDLIDMFAIDNDTQTLGTVVPTGVFTPIGAAIPCASCTWSGLAFNPRLPVAKLYGSATDGAQSCLYTLDTATGAATEVGCQATAPLLIDIAMNCRGEIWGHDIGDDNIYTLDRLTGAATLVGPTGVDSNFAQGMSFDRTDGALYAHTYQGGGANTYGRISLLSGTLNPLTSSNPTGEFEGETITGCPASVPGALTTLFASNNQFAGNTFDVDPVVDLQIDAFAVNLTAGALTTMEIYMRDGTSDGAEGDPAGWTSLGTVDVTPAGQDLPTMVALSTPTLLAGQTYGFYVDVASYPSASLRYTNGGPGTIFSNADVSLTTFHGKATPAFTGTTFVGRQWNGTIFYVLNEPLPFVGGFETGDFTGWTNVAP